jgi:hypothetical protein
MPSVLRERAARSTAQRSEAQANSQMTRKGKCPVKGVHVRIGFLTQLLIGYLRVSTVHQDLASQRAGLAASASRRSGSTWTMA